MTELLYFDTYALFEIIRGNSKYQKYTNVRIILTKLNLFELFYGILREYDKKIALEALRRYSELAIDFDNDVIVEAAELKLLNKKQKLSMTDCIGYTIARRFGIKFLTGDEGFRDLDNVEFVKK